MCVREAAGELPHCAAASLLSALEGNPDIGYTEEDVKSTLGSMYTG